MNALLNIQQILQEQEQSAKEADSSKWSVLSLAHGSHAGAEGIMDIINQVKAGHCVHYFTYGAWSLFELLIAATEITGPANIYLSTYAMNETSARAFAKLKDDRIVNEMYCIIDDRAEVRSAASLQLLRSLCNSWAMVRCHAKVTVLEGVKYSVVISGSANYTENKRLESGMIIADKAAAGFHKGWILKHIQNGNKL